MEKHSNNKESNLNENFNNALREFSFDDQKVISEEIKLLQASIYGLKNKIRSFRLIDDSSDEMKEFFKSRGGVPNNMDGIYGDQAKLDSMLDELNYREKDFKNIQDGVLSKDMNSIISSRENRIAFDDKKYGAYSISGKEYHREENRFNEKIKEEREKKDQEQIDKLRNDIRNMPMN